MSAMAFSIFQYNLLGTAAGLLGFPISYSFLGYDQPLKAIKREEINLTYVIGMLCGATISAKGLILAAKATDSLSVVPMLYSGLIMVLGLVATHESYVRGFLE